MKKKSTRKILPAKPKRPQQDITSFTFIRYISIGLIVLALIIIGGMISKAMSKVHVLGANTGPFILADQGNDINEDTISQPTTQVDQIALPPQTNTSEDNSDSSTETQPNGNISSNEPHPATSPQPSDSTQVDCIGPDGKHFTTDFHACQELNQKWGRSNFNFTPLEKTTFPPTKGGTKQPALPRNIQDRQQEGEKKPLPVPSGTQFLLKNDGNGSATITAKHKDGSEEQLQPDAFAQINDTLKEKDMEVSTNSANGFSIKSGTVRAETNFPLSIDPTTKTLSVTTPTGTADVAILPNQAVQNVLTHRLLSHVLSSASQNAASSAAAEQTISLTQVNNQPAFAIPGVSEKKLLGIFTVAFAKTVFVSAQTGQIVQTQENTFDRILEAFSL